MSDIPEIVVVTRDDLRTIQAALWSVATRQQSRETEERVKQARDIIWGYLFPDYDLYM